MRPRHQRIVLVNMPWASTQRPSLPLAILRRLCSEAGVEAQVLYPNLDMAAEIGFEPAAHLSQVRHLYGLSEHLFSAQIYGREAVNSDAFLRRFAEALRPTADTYPWGQSFSELSLLERLRDEVVPRFLDATLARVMALEPAVVGFTATFNQVMASLALAVRLRSALPELRIVAGGASFDGEMGVEYHRAFMGSIDHVFLGEAEESFREYLRRLLSDESTAGISGTTWTDGREVHVVPGRPLADLSASPTPDFDDFFAEKRRVLEATGKDFNIEVLPFESSRGCWWGQKHQCMFCGLNHGSMPFRSRPAERVIADLVYLAARYSVVKFSATDWILTRTGRGELFRRLTELDLDLDLFYEVRSDMKKAEIAEMKRAGITRVQPGIESFSTPLLELMGKGTTGIRQVQFLRWCEELGVSAAYNLLARFPGEKPEWYREMERLIRRIRHLQPPGHEPVEIEMHRFAPLFEERASLGVDRVALRPDYAFNLPSGTVDPLKAGYFFSFESKRLPDDEGGLAALSQTVNSWIADRGRPVPPRYEYRVGPGFIHVEDTRGPEPRVMDLADLYHDVLLLCDAIQTRETLARDLERVRPTEVRDGSLDRVVDELIASDLLLAEGRQLLTLPIGHRPRTTEELRRFVLGSPSDSSGETCSAVPPAAVALSGS